MIRSIFSALVVFVLCAVCAQPLAAEQSQHFRIAIIQHQLFRPFEQAHNGFIDSLTAFGYADKITIVEDFNAKSDIKALNRVVGNLSRRKDLDLIFSIGTHATKRLIAHVKDTPVIFTIVGDPEHAGIVSDWRSSGRNYTGVETPNYYSKVVRLMHTFVPFQSLGMIYLEGSPSHEAGIAQIDKLSRELGFQFIRKGFPLRNSQGKPFPEEQIRKNMRDALETVCPRVEAFFVQTSNTFTNEFKLFRDAFWKHRIISAGDPTNIHKGLVMGIGKDANRFGRQCAQYAIKILNGTPPRSLPMDVGTKLTIDVNLKAAEKIAYEPPFELISAADNLYHEVVINP